MASAKQDQPWLVVEDNEWPASRCGASFATVAWNFAAVGEGVFELLIDRPPVLKPEAKRAIRLKSGLLQAPWQSRFAVRASETLATTQRDGIGWIEQALIDNTDRDLANSERLAGLVADIIRLRVGGEFWAPAPDWPATVSHVVKVSRSARLDEALDGALDQTGAKKIGVLLPRRLWATAARRRVLQRGLSCHVGPFDPWLVLDRVETVDVDGDDELGLLALFAGRSVRCAASGYLTGWGLTTDHPNIERRGDRILLQLASAALVEGVRYRDLFSGRESCCEEAVARLADWRRVVDQDRHLRVLAGVAWWKRSRLRSFLAPAARATPFLDKAEDCVTSARDGVIAVWPSRTPAGLTDLAKKAGTPLWRIEDGFVRSVGLGSDLLAPCSIVIDRRGVYYDPSVPSDLEVILSETDFSESLRRRAKKLTERLLAGRLTKYNMGGGDYARPTSGRIVLAPGQVEDDQSLIAAGGDCTGNLDLLRRVREQEPDAYIIYKPHPDVEAGNRIGAVPDQDVLRFADAIERKADMPALLEAVDAVHVLTSLTGFEALLREREVVVHGQPFYSGWGLTRDLAPPPRRGRQLTLAELVAGVLILYPRYLDPVTGLLCPPEVLVERLAKRRAGPSPLTLVLRVLRRTFEPRPSAGRFDRIGNSAE